MTKINYSTAVFIIKDDVRAIKVTYEKDTDKNKPVPAYLYKTFDKTIQVDDYVVVPTRTRHGMTVCRVSEVDVQLDLDSDVEVKWVIDRVDSVTYGEVLHWEEKAMEKIKSAQAHKKRKDLIDAMKDSINGAFDEIQALPVYASTGA